MGAKYIIDGDRLEGIADGVRDLTHQHGKLSLEQIEDELKNSYQGVPVDVSYHINTTTGRWERPQEYPDLDSITIGENENVVYLTYDLRKTVGYGWIGIWCSLQNSNTTWSLQRGHLSNGEFVADTNYEDMATDTKKIIPLDSSDGDIQLWRVTSADNIIRFAFTPSTTTNSTCMAAMVQPCVERVGRLDYITSFYSYGINNTATYYCYSTIWLERDKMACAGKSKCTSLYYAWAGSYSLQELDLSDWDTSNWTTLTNMGLCFSDCRSLISLDLSGWDVSGFQISLLTSVFANCISLETLNLSGWDTTNWTITSMSGIFENCYLLKSLDISNWKTDNWNVSTMYHAFYNCYNLQELDLSGWDTSNWHVTNLESCWSCCHALNKLDISTWDTTNWAVTTLYATWYFCGSLKELDVSTWDTQNWAVTNLASTWYSCFSLKELDLSNWDTSNWAVTSLNNTWDTCNSLTKLDISTWDTTNWTPPNLSNTWRNLLSLTELDISNWNTSNWAITSLSGTWQNCYSLTELDIGNWDTSNWEVNNMYYTWYGDYALHSLDISSWDVSNFLVTDNRNMFSSNKHIKTALLPAGLTFTDTANNNTGGGQYSMINFNGISIYKAHSYANSPKLTIQSLVNILDKLPTVSAATTITLGQINRMKLTPEQIAVATQKGWTVA